MQPAGSRKVLYSGSLRREPASRVHCLGIYPQRLWPMPLGSLVDSSMPGMQMRDIKSWGLGSKEPLLSLVVGRDRDGQTWGEWAACLLYICGWLDLGLHYS